VKTPEIIKEKKMRIGKVAIMVPFFSGEKRLLSLIRSTTGTEEIAVCIQAVDRKKRGLRGLRHSALLRLYAF